MVHEVKLEKFVYYGNEDICTLPDYAAVMRLYDRYPNAAEWGLFAKKTEIFYQPKTIIACPRCVKGFDES